jgi:hypothetical protein
MALPGDTAARIAEAPLRGAITAAAVGVPSSERERGDGCEQQAEREVADPVGAVANDDVLVAGGGHEWLLRSDRCASSVAG